MQGVLGSSTIQNEQRQIRDRDEIGPVVRELESHKLDTAHGETTKAVLLSLSPSVHHLAISSHGLMDGVSFWVLMRDF